MTSGELQKITVAGDEGSQRLDRVLAARSPDLSRSRLKALILAGQVSVGTNVVRDPAFHVRAGDTIEIDLPPAADPEPQGESIPLDIVYEDDDIIVLNKPKG
ncbi:S4 domain-containing protein, partial [Staphylococcus aureus]|uniref:S4 domain-containing protein n=1 Tax=Staphylococcus aureus TaxID=1280 RepID=UPI00210C027D